MLRSSVPVVSAYHISRLSCLITEAEPFKLMMDGIALCMKQQDESNRITLKSEVAQCVMISFYEEIVVPRMHIDPKSAEIYLLIDAIFN